ncbi:hypothetical protein CYMTET_35721 [Cymbomonas tetramitiformis]|uniref:Uncharacterized protein n=1 Tax=Cymbomonas tetramitiformis TaxID=36881 RepID=A0AAE0KNW6_9CHLO|nr:hypothetical protein CYMTET_35721 [Cymbomonas tetramitiformis]|eukprot:gene195-340_t
MSLELLRCVDEEWWRLHTERLRPFASRCVADVGRPRSLRYYLALYGTSALVMETADAASLELSSSVRSASIASEFSVLELSEAVWKKAWPERSACMRRLRDRLRLLCASLDVHDRVWEEWRAIHDVLVNSISLVSSPEERAVDASCSRDRMLILQRQQHAC